jgi:hypothetical protein
MTKIPLLHLNWSALSEGHDILAKANTIHSLSSS